MHSCTPVNHSEDEHSNNNKQQHTLIIIIIIIIITIIIIIIIIIIINKHMRRSWNKTETFRGKKNLFNKQRVRTCSENPSMSLQSL